MTNAGNTHCTARAEPFTIWDFWQGWVQAVQVVRGWARVAAQQLPSILTDTAELHVVILLFFTTFLLLILLLLWLPLDALLLLGQYSQSKAEGDSSITTALRGPKPRVGSQEGGTVPDPSHSHRQYTSITAQAQCRLLSALKYPSFSLTVCLQAQASLPITQTLCWCPPPRSTPTGTHTHTVWAAPLALRGFLQLRVQADEVVGTRTGVTQDDLPSLLAHLAVVLVVRLVAITFFNYKQGTDAVSGTAEPPALPRQLLLYGIVKENATHFTSAPPAMSPCLSVPQHHSLSLHTASSHLCLSFSLHTVSSFGSFRLSMENARTWRGCKGGSQRNLHRPQRQQMYHATVTQLRTLLLGLLHSPWVLAGCRTGAPPAPCRKRREGRSEGHKAHTLQEAEHSPPSCPQAQKAPFGSSKAKLISISSKSTVSWCRGTALNRDGDVINQTNTKPPPVKEYAHQSGPWPLRSCQTPIAAALHLPMPSPQPWPATNHTSHTDKHHPPAQPRLQPGLLLRSQPHAALLWGCACANHFPRSPTDSRTCCLRTDLGRTRHAGGWQLPTCSHCAPVPKAPLSAAAALLTQCKPKQSWTRARGALGHGRKVVDGKVQVSG